MFNDSGSKATVSHNQTDDLWALHVSTPQYWAWKDWLVAQIGYYRPVQSNWLTVWDQWPPLTSAQACRVAQRISDMRDESRDLRPVPRWPAPWDGARPIVPEQYRDLAA